MLNDKRLFKYVLTFLLMALPAAANESFGHMYVGEDVVPPRFSMNGIKHNVLAVKAYTLGNEDCSLVLISRTGYALTNRHCLIEFLSGKKALFTQRANGLTYLMVDKNKMKDLVGTITLKTRVDYIKEPSLAPDKSYSALDAAFKRSIKTVPFKIVEIPPGIVNTPETDDIADTFARKRDLDIGEFSDFALIKLELESTPCIVLGSAQSGDDVYSVGYPGAAVGRQREGRVVFSAATLSFGRIELSSKSSFDSQLENFSFKEKILYSFGIRKRISEIRKTQAEQSDVLIFHSALISAGNSGSGLFNGRGELIGLNVGGFVVAASDPFSERTPEDDYAPGSYISIPVQKISQHLRSKLSSAEFAHAFNCH